MVDARELNREHDRYVAEVIDLPIVTERHRVGTTSLSALVCSLAQRSEQASPDVSYLVEASASLTEAIDNSGIADGLER